VNNIEDIKMLTYLVLCPVEVQRVVLAFADKKVVESEKKKKLKGGHENPLIKWMNNNGVVQISDADVQGWPLYMFFKEQRDVVLITRNDMLLFFYRDMKKLTVGVERNLIELKHEFSARLYAYWLLSRTPSKLEMVLTDLVELFGVRPDNYKSYTLIEKKILHRVSGRLAAQGIKITYKREPIKYAKKLVISFYE